MVVGFAPGGSTDLIACHMAQKLSSQTNANALHVPYKGGSPAIADLEDTQLI